MSLAVALYNHHGIVMCADKLVNTKIEDQMIHLSFTEQKIFLVEGKYGLTYTGNASIGTVPVSAVLKNYFRTNEIGESDPYNWLLNLAIYFNNQMPEDSNIIFIFCGYYNNKQFVITTNTSAPEITTMNDSSGLLRSGEVEFAAHITDSPLISFDYEKFTIQDAIYFTKFLNETVATMMNYGIYFPTVSKECDILVIQPNDIHWV